jgi:hypothetical protein
MRVGIGPAKFGLKFNFYNNAHKGVYVSLYPQIQFAVPGGRLWKEPPGVIWCVVHF